MSLSQQLSSAYADVPVGRLTAAQRDEFALNGCLVIEDALSAAEVARYREVIARLDRSILNNTTVDSGIPRAAGDPLELRNAVAHAPELLELMVHPRCFPLVGELMGPQINLTTSHAYIRPRSPEGAGRAHKAIAWHRDGPAPSPYGGPAPLPWLYTKIGYFFTDLTIPDTGALRVIPGSHRYGDRPPVAVNEDGDPHGSIELKIKPGTAVIFENRLMHAVGPNFTDIARENVYFGYCWRFLRPIDFITQSPELFEGMTPIQRQLLAEPDRALSYYLPQEGDVPLKTWLGELPPLS